MKSKLINLIIILIILFLNIILLRYYNNIRYIETVRTDTIVRVDTIEVIRPIPKYITKIKTVRDTLLTTDTIPKLVEVNIPIERKVYEDSSYYAVISGFQTQLDTLMVFPKETTIEAEKVVYKPNKGIKIRPSINVGYGYGLLNKKSDLYVGVGGSITF